jgi:hypothetical protein
MRFFLLLTVLIILPAACIKDAPTDRKAADMLLYMAWKVSRSWQSAAVYTNLYPGTRFSFGSDGTMYARRDTTNGLLQTGTWTNTELNDQSSIVNFQFPQPNSFSAMNNSWVISKIDASHLLLRGKTNPSDSMMLVFD